MRLYKRPCPSAHRLVGPSVMLSSKSMKNGLLRNLNDLDSAGRGGSRDEEEGGTRRKKERGGRRNKEEGGTGRKEEREGRRDEESEKMKKLSKNEIRKSR